MSMYSAMARQFRQEGLARKIACSVFAPDQVTGVALCPPVWRVGLYFGVHSPRAVIMQLLHDQGLSSPEELRARVDVPSTRLMVRPWVEQDDEPDPWQRLDVSQADPWLVLQQALCLGLCTAHRYDPERPVVWTHTSLTRQLIAYQMGRFYQ